MQHNLMITIEEEPQETEEETQTNSIIDELQKLHTKIMPSFASLDTDRSCSERNNLIKKNNCYLNQLLHYMEGENYKNDNSYSTLTNIKGFSSISKSFFLTNSSCKQILQSDLSSEWKLIKLITEDLKHKENQIDLLKALKRNNRYTDLMPYQFNFVPYQFLNSYTKDNQEEWYINASYLNGPFQEDEKAFIATQGPLQNTMSKFWKLCFNQDVKLIIMLCSFEEEGRKKCELYFPNEINQSLHFQQENMTITLGNKEWIIPDCLIKREMIVTINNQSKPVYHIQMTNWPDHSSPVDSQNNGYMTIDYIIKTIAEFRQEYPMSPVLTHCSAGTGRTGTLIAIFNLIKCVSFFYNVNEKDIRPFASVFNMVRKLREQRSGMISSLEQYKYIYYHIIQWISINFGIQE